MKHVNKVNNLRKEIKRIEYLLRKAEPRSRATEILSLSVETLRWKESKMTRNYITLDPA